MQDSRLIQFASEKWDPVTEQSSVKVTKKVENGSLKSKGETVFPLPLKAILAITQDLDRKKEYDSLYDSGKILKQYRDDTLILHLAYKAVWPTTPRDFCLISQTRYFEDKVVELATSIVSIYSYCKEILEIIILFCNPQGNLTVPTSGKSCQSRSDDGRNNLYSKQRWKIDSNHLYYSDRFKGQFAEIDCEHGCSNRSSFFGQFAETSRNQ